MFYIHCFTLVLHVSYRGHISHTLTQILDCFLSQSFSHTHQPILQAVFPPQERLPIFHWRLIGLSYILFAGYDGYKLPLLQWSPACQWKPNQHSFAVLRCSMILPKSDDTRFSDPGIIQTTKSASPSTREVIVPRLLLKLFISRNLKKPGHFPESVYTAGWLEQNACIPDEVKKKCVSIFLCSVEAQKGPLFWIMKVIIKENSCWSANESTMRTFTPSHQNQTLMKYGIQFQTKTILFPYKTDAQSLVMQVSNNNTDSM